MRFPDQNFICIFFADNSVTAKNVLKVRIHGAILREILRTRAKLHRVSTPKIVARNMAHNIAAVEFRPTSATLRATNFFVYPPSAAFRAIL